jgi:phage tail-like protein
MPVRDNPYGAFNFKVEFGEAAGAPAIMAGFSDVSGLGTEINFSDYRSGIDKFNTARKIPNTNKNDEVTLKRGLIGSTDIFEWFKKVREGEYLPRTVTVVWLDEARKEAVSIKLRNAQPKKWLGPTGAAKGGGEVAMEELHLVHEGVEYESA